MTVIQGLSYHRGGVSHKFYQRPPSAQTRPISAATTVSVPAVSLSVGGTLSSTARSGGGKNSTTGLASEYYVPKTADYVYATDGNPTIKLQEGALVGQGLLRGLDKRPNSAVHRPKNHNDVPVHEYVQPGYIAGSRPINGKKSPGLGQFTVGSRPASALVAGNNRRLRPGSSTIGSRPGSGRPDSAVTGPTSGGTRPGSAVTRPASGITRPGSAVTRPASGRPASAISTGLRQNRVPAHDTNETATEARDRPPEKELTLPFDRHNPECGIDPVEMRSAIGHVRANVGRNLKTICGALKWPATSGFATNESVLCRPRPASAVYRLRANNAEVGQQDELGKSTGAGAGGAAKERPMTSTGGSTCSSTARSDLGKLITRRTANGERFLLENSGGICTGLDKIKDESYYLNTVNPILENGDIGTQLNEAKTGLNALMYRMQDLGAVIVDEGYESHTNTLLDRERLRAKYSYDLDQEPKGAPQRPQSSKKDQVNNCFQNDRTDEPARKKNAFENKTPNVEKKNKQQSQNPVKDPDRGNDGTSGRENDSDRGSLRTSKLDGRRGSLTANIEHKMAQQKEQREKKKRTGDDTLTDDRPSSGMAMSAKPSETTRTEGGKTDVTASDAPEEKKPEGSKTLGGEGRFLRGSKTLAKNKNFGPSRLEIEHAKQRGASPNTIQKMSNGNLDVPTTAMSDVIQDYSGPNYMKAKKATPKSPKEENKPKSPKPGKKSPRAKAKDNPQQAVFDPVKDFQKRWKKMPLAWRSNMMGWSTKSAVPLGNVKPCEDPARLLQEMNDELMQAQTGPLAPQTGPLIMQSVPVGKQATPASNPMAQSVPAGGLGQGCVWRRVSIDKAFGELLKFPEKLAAERNDSSPSPGKSSDASSVGMDEIGLDVNEYDTMTSNMTNVMSPSSRLQSANLCRTFRRGNVSQYQKGSVGPSRPASVRPVSAKSSKNTNNMSSTHQTDFGTVPDRSEFDGSIIKGQETQQANGQPSSRPSSTHVKGIMQPPSEGKRTSLKKVSLVMDEPITSLQEIKQNMEDAKGLNHLLEDDDLGVLEGDEIVFREGEIDIAD